MQAPSIAIVLGSIACAVSVRRVSVLPTSVGDLLTGLALPLAGALPLAIGLVRHARRITLPGQPLLPRRSEAVLIVTGAGLLSLYVAFFAHYTSPALRISTVSIIVLSVVGNACVLLRATRRSRT